MSTIQRNPDADNKQDGSNFISRQERLILDTSSVGIMINRVSDDEILYANQTVAKMLGISDVSEIIGKRGPDYYWDPKDREILVEQFQAKGVVTGYELRARRTDGNMFWVSLSLRHFDIEGQQTLILEIIDITERKQTELDLMLRDRALTSSLNAVIILGFPDNKPIYANDALLKMTGYSLEEVKHLTLTEITGNPEAPTQISSAIQNQGSFVGEEFIKRKDGSSFPATFFSTLIKDGNERPIAIQSTFFDITEQKSAEEALQESQSLYQSLVEISPLSICRKDLEGRFTYANKRFLESSNAKLEDLLGKSDFDLHPAELAQKYRNDDLAVMESGQIQDFTEERAVHDESGGTALVHTVKTPIYDRNGKVNGIQISFWDVTDRERADKAIHASEERFRRFTEATVEGLVFHERGSIVDANPAAMEMFGLSSSDALLGRSLLEFIAPEFHEMVLQQMKLETVLPYEVMCIRQNGSIFPVETSTRVYKEGDRAIRATSIRDISARKQAEARLQTMVENAPEAILLIDMTTGLFLEPNENALKLYGLSRTELTKVGPADMSPATQPNGRPSVEMALENINAAMRGETPVFEWIHINGQGKQLNCEIRLARLPGDTPLVRCSVTDISARKQAEEKLNESEERYRRLSEATIDGIVIHDKGILLDANQTFATMFGYELSDVIGMSALDFLTPETREVTAQNIRSGYEKAYDVMGLRKDGSTFPVEISGKAIHYGGHEVRVTALRDITERKQAETEVQKSQQLLQSFLNNFPDAAWAKDLEGHFLIANRYLVENMYGTTLDQIIGKTLYDTFPKDAADFIWTSEKRLLETGEGIVMEENIPQTDGQVHNKITTKFPLYDADGNINGVGGVLIDITERKLAEQNLRENQYLLQTVLDNFPGIVFWKTNDLLYSGCNRAFAAGAGLADPSEIVGKSDFDLPWAKTEAEAYQADDRAVLKSGQGRLHIVETQYQADGKQVWFDTSKVPLRNINGEIIGLLGISSDISERKLLEQEIETSFERRGRQVQLSTQISQSIASVTSLEDLYQRVVTEVKEQFGYYHTQLLRYSPATNSVILVTGYGETGKQMLTMGHQMPMGAGLIGTAAATGETILRPDLANDPDWNPNSLLPETKGEIAVPIKLGGIVLGVLDVQSAAANALGADDQLLLEGLCGQIAIAIQNQQSTEAVQTQIKLLQRIIDNIPNPIFHKDNRGVYRNCNIAFEKYLGKSRDEIIGKSVFDMSPQDLAEKYHAMDVVLFEKPDVQIYESQVVYADGTRHNVIFNKASLVGENKDDIEGLVGVIIDITERKQAEEKLQETLQTLERNYRATVREGWQTYRQTSSLPEGFQFEDGSVSQWAQESEASSADERLSLNPISLPGGEEIGTLWIESDLEKPLSAEERDFLQQVSEQIALALESARLFGQTQSALAQSERLFKASSQLAQVENLQELVKVATETMNIPVVNRAILDIFTYNSAGELERMDVAANWWNGTGQEPNPVGTHFPIETLRVMPLFISPIPVFFSDSFNDERFDEAALQIAKNLNLRSGAILPLQGREGRQIGVLFLEAEEPHVFSSEEVRLFEALAPQITTVLENRRQFERAQQQAEREAKLNAISQKIQSATTIEAVLQIAARELGHALGAPRTIAQLSLKDKS